MSNYDTLDAAEKATNQKNKKSLKEITHEYWYVGHHVGDKSRLCSLDKCEKLSEDYRSFYRKIHRMVHN